MEKMQILFGFDSPDFENAIIRLLKSKGIEAEISSKMTKLNIREFLEKNHNCNTVVLKEAFSKDVYYTAEEIAQLTDMRDVNVIIVLSDKRRGTDYMCTLYAAGITNAIFQKGRNGGASPKDIATLMLQRRTRKDAREYYGIASNKIELGFLDNTTYVEFYRDLKQEGSSLLENYINVCARMSPQQIADFTRRLPKDDINELAQFEEFHVIMQLLKRFGIDLKIKKPKTARVGLNTPVGITIEDERIHVTPAETEKKVTDNKKEQKNATAAANDESIEEFIVRTPAREPIKEEIVKEEPKVEPIKEEKDPYGGITLADLFAGGVTLNGLGNMSSSVASEQSEKVETVEKAPEEKKSTSIFDKVLEEIANTANATEEKPIIEEQQPKEEVYQEKVVVEPEQPVTDVVKDGPVKELKEEPIEVAPESKKKEKKEKKEKTKPKKEHKEVEKDIVREEPKKSTVFSMEEESTNTAIVFDDYDDSYDDISLDSGADSRISIPFLIAILFLVAAVICLVVFGNGKLITLF